MLPPTAHVAFLRDELGGFAVIGFQEVDGFLPLGEPEFGLGHKSPFKSCSELLSDYSKLNQNVLGQFCQWPFCLFVIGYVVPPY